MEEMDVLKINNDDDDDLLASIMYLWLPKDLSMKTSSNTIQYNKTIFFERLTKIKSYSKTLYNVSSVTSLSAVMNFEQVSFESGFERWGRWRFTDDNR